MENATTPPSPQSPHATADPGAIMTDVPRSPEKQPDAPHVVIQLIQCHRCSYPLQNPLRLPCGNTVCRACLPPTRPRTGITYPIAAGREEGFLCHWDGRDGCAGDHCVGDCGTDVLLGKLVALYEESLSGAGTGQENGKEQRSLMVRWKTEAQEQHSAQIDRAGWLEGVYGLASQGRFPWSAREVVYEGNLLADDRDHLTCQSLKENLRAELDCQVCYALILDPLTTPCGHTFCRKCVARVLDHTDLCPICRRKLGLPPTVQSEPLNKTLAGLIDHFFPDQVSARREALAQDETGVDIEKKLALFVCTLSFPTMPTFLHIFEPRYRLMIRRVVESGDGKFGMVMYNRRARAQPGAEEFMDYGTLLQIERYELLPDGRSLVIANGVSRFKVLEAGMLDGYHVGRVERVDDVSLAEEERLELAETSAPANPAPEAEPDGQAVDPLPPVDSMSTQQLLDSARKFIARQRRAAAPWLHPRIMLAYGPVPNDAARFPWWLACVLPLSEEEKYPILAATSVRERLKIAARWGREIEARDLYVPEVLSSLVLDPQNTNMNDGNRSTGSSLLSVL
ncbi:hypothetical protein N7474_010909 [Penicillium riverlandense]|uniref:uncharacterized protein n=1 Tax=Penicillium riverlandense TaxID=1903569 RepID=UPI002549ACD9|nr:uncharacterized protein N7474_010909 [Penicillium riverlandense]KAJ5805022.1 hypothetical protein N7474_010909 [Penicillium riverlandense]